MQASRNGWLDAAAIEACGDGFYSTTSQLACVDAVAGIRGDAATAVEFCTGEYYASDAQLACLAAF